VRKLFFFLTLCLIAGIAYPLFKLFDDKPASFSPSVKTFFYNLGQRKLSVSIHQYGETNGLVFINLHDDENTSVEATKMLLEKKGGLLITIENLGKRNIKFKMGPSIIQFDPNRMFSESGIRSTLDLYQHSINEQAVTEIERLGQWILQLIPENPKCVIALHNNTPGNFSIRDYVKGNVRSEAASKVYISQYQDTDDFFLTTEEDVYNSLSEAGYNVLLQDNLNARDDGSLSIYCGRNKIPYVNCETEHGKIGQYKEMMEKLIDEVNGPKQTEYDFIIQQADGFSANIHSTTKIYFDNKEIGLVKKIAPGDEITTTSGKLSIKKGFKIYSNTDFFLIQKTSNSYIDIRIDPTREKKPLSGSMEPIRVFVKDY
jgi:hypothetical protein